MTDLSNPITIARSFGLRIDSRKLTAVSFSSSNTGRTLGLVSMSMPIVERQFVLAGKVQNLLPLAVLFEDEIFLCSDRG